MVAPKTFKLAVGTPGTFDVRRWIYEALSQNATVALAGLLQGWSITSAVDYRLPGSQPLAGVPKSVLVTDDGTRYTLPVLPDAPAGVDLAVVLPPMGIRTFMFTLQKK